MIQQRLITTPIFLILLLWGLQAAATSVLPVSLQHMTTAAEVIFHGIATSNEVRHDPQSDRVATFTTFEVIETIKGDVGATHTIKQIGGQLPGSNVRMVIHGVPRFSVGQEYVVFLPKASSIGFSSPIGLSQGKFNIRKLNGETVISNGRPLAALMETTPRPGLPNAPSALVTSQVPSLKAIADHPSSVRIQDFMQTVRSMINE